MNNPRPSVVWTAVAALGLGVSSALGQAAPTAPTTPGTEEAIKLDPFSVKADSDVGFVASSSLAGGRISTALKDTPVAYSVITKEFLDAFNITNIADSGQWSVNTDQNVGDYTDYGYAGGLNGRVRVRGISANTPTRNFFPFNAQEMDSFDIDRVDYARGANAVLFGAGGAGGTQNTGTKQALTSRTIREARVQVGSWNRYRLTADINQPINDKLAIRTNLMWATSDSWRDRLWDDKDGVHITTTWRPVPKVTLRAEFEYTFHQLDHALNGFNEYISAWDGQTYDTNMPATGAGAPTAAQLALWGVDRTPGRFVARPDYGGRMINWKNQFRPTGANYNANSTLTNYVNTAAGRVPIKTVGFNLRAEAMIDSAVNSVVPDNTRYALAQGASPFFRLPTQEDTPLWDDPKHEYPTFQQHTWDYSAYATYSPFENLFIEIAGDINRTPRTANNSQRRAMREFRMDISRTLPTGEPNPWFLHTYQDHAEYFQERNDDFQNLRLQSVYVKETRIGKFQFGAMAGRNLEKIKNRSSHLIIPADWILPDARGWVNNGEVNEFFPYQRLYTDETNRGWATPNNGLHDRPTTVVDPVTGVTRQLTPYWMYDARREDNVYDARRNYKYLQFAGNWDLFKNRLILIGAFRRDFTFFSQNRIKAPGDYPKGWNGLDLVLRQPAPPDYQTLMYTPKDASGKALGPPIPADTRPRISQDGAQIPLPQYANDRFRDDFDSPNVIQNVNTHTIGAVINVTRTIGLYANRSLTFNVGSPNQDIYNVLIPTTSATSDDAGVRFTLPGGKLSMNLGWYHAYQEGAAVDPPSGFIDSYNSIGDLGPVGDLFGRNIRDLARFRTNNIKTTATNDTKGYEFEATANLTQNWRVILNAAKTDSAQIDNALDAVAFFGLNDAKVRQILADGGILIDPATQQAFINPAVDDPTKIDHTKAQAAADAWNRLQTSVIPSTVALAKLRAPTVGSVRWSGNLATDYRFRRGFLNGLRVGVGINWRGGQVSGNKGSDTIRDPNNPNNAIDDPRYDASEPIITQAYYSTTGTMSYTWRLKESKRYAPKTIQFDLSVQNLLNDRSPIYSYSTGSQNTSVSVFLPNSGSLSDPSRHAVSGNFFYFEPRNFMLTAKMDF